VFGRKKVAFLGMVLTKDGVAPDPEKVSAIKDFPVPTCVKELRSFLGASQWFRRHIRGYGIMAAPLYRLLRKEQEFRWSKEHQEAFDKIKDMLTSDQILAYPDWKKPFYCLADASGTAIGGSLLQKDNQGRIRPLGYCGRALTDSERKLPISMQEALAAVYTVKYYLSYLKYAHFYLLTDHISLRSLFETKEPKAQFGRWVAFLSSLNYTIQHRPGREMALPDCLSRRNYPKQEESKDPLFASTRIEEFNPFGKEVGTQTGSNEEAPAAALTGKARQAACMTKIGMWEIPPIL